jgi:hypothetical protein
VTELELLRRRRDLILTSAYLQRATVVRRLGHIEAHPLRIALGLATRVASVPLAFKLASGAMALAARMARRRSASMRRPPAT